MLSEVLKKNNMTKNNMTKNNMIRKKNYIINTD